MTFTVDDLDATERFLRGRNVKIAPAAHGSARQITATDPDGNVLVFLRKD